MLKPHYLSESNISYCENGYQDEIDQNDEKFRLWSKKCFHDRKKAFSKVMVQSGLKEDGLSIWIVEQMNMLLVKSELG